MKICGFFNQNQNAKAKFFRNVFANAIICFVLIGLFTLTYAGGILNVSSTGQSKAIYQGNTKNNNITLMINVYWGNEFIYPMLDILNKNNIKTTFFIGGTWAKQYPDILKKIYDEGHEIGNHGYYHKDHKNISYELNLKEISDTHNLIKKLLNIEINLFAPPSGSYSQTTLDIADSLNYKTIMWTRDTIDWRDQNTELIYSRAIKNASGGDLILMHPTEKTLEALPNIIKTLKENGFNLTTVSKTIS